jgi:hypothetical protein
MQIFGDLALPDDILEILGRRALSSCSPSSGLGSTIRGASLFIKKIIPLDSRHFLLLYRFVRNNSNGDAVYENVFVSQHP